VAPAVLLGAVLIGAALLLTVAAVAGPSGTSSRRVRANLQRGLAATAPAAGDTVEAEEARSALGALAVRLTPKPSRRLLRTLHAKAGYPGAWTLEKMATIKLGLPLILGLLALMVLSEGAQPLLVLLGLAVVVVAYFVPELLLYSRGTERSEQITLELADTLDQMLISVEAGLGFDAAMDRAGRNGNGPLSEELVRTLQDMQLGHSRREAYEDLARRTDVPDLRRFVRSVIQADKNGVGIAGVLRTQAAEMRMKRRQRAEQKAMQIPVKVIFPLMLFILPVLFIVIMGPVALNMMASWTV
jgi:tight adherence protein C